MSLKLVIDAWVVTTAEKQARLGWHKSFRVFDLTRSFFA
jgi:hypothetical protein